MEEFFAAYRADGTGWVGRGSPGTIAAMIPPEGIRVFACSEESFYAGGATLAEVRGHLWEKVKALREAKIDGGATFAGKVAQTDLLSRTNISGAALAAVIAKSAAAPFEVTWTFADNSTADLDADEMISLGITAMGHVDACYARARVLRADIDAAADMAALLSINIEQGWPS